MKPRTVLIAVFALALAVAVGCGGASDKHIRLRRLLGGGRKTVARRLLDAAGRLDEVIPAFQQDRGRQGRRFKPPTAPSGDQSRAVEGGLKADVVDVLARARHGHARRRRARRAGLGPDTPHKGFVSTSVVVFIVRKGNPKDIQGWDDLIKPGVKVVTPNPFTSGAAKWNLLAAYGAQLERRQDPRPGLAYLSELITSTSGPGQVRPRRAADLHRRQGRRADLLRERGDRPRSKKGEDVDYVVPARHDPDREPDRGRRQDAPADGAGVRELRARRAGAEDLRRLGLPPGRRGGARRAQVEVPGPAEASSRSRTSAAGRRSTTSSSTPRTARSPRSRRTRGSSTAK